MITAFRKQGSSLDVALCLTYDFCIMFFLKFFFFYNSVWLFLIRKKGTDINSSACVQFTSQQLATLPNDSCIPVGSILFSYLLWAQWRNKTQLLPTQLPPLVTTDGKCFMAASLCLSQYKSSSVVELGIPAISLQKLLQLPPSGNSWESCWACAAYL